MEALLQIGTPLGDNLLSSIGLHMTSFRIGNKKVGNASPVYIIAEACDNHMGDLNVAHEMCRLAKLSGADAIKFQHHLVDEEMLPEVPSSDNFEEPLYEFLKKNALSIECHKSLKEYCESLDITYLCTPFSWSAARELSQLDVLAYKIGSGEMTDIPTLVKIANLGKPMLISTGMSDFEEIDRTYSALAQQKVEFALMNCVSEYPPVYEDMNLNVIGRMKEEFSAAVIGHSDHSPDLFTSFAAVALGAKILEKHVIIDKRTPGPDQSVSIDFVELAALVEGVRKIEASLGNKKVVHDRESQIRAWALRSLVSIKNIKKGQVITKDMIWSKRPGTGIPSYKMEQFIGRVASRDIVANTMLKWSDLLDE